MNLQWKKSFAIPVIIQLALITIFFHSQIYATAQAASPLIKIVDANTNLKSITLGGPDQTMPLGGFPFTVNITLEGRTDSLFTYQVAVAFDKSKINCTAAWIPLKTDPNFVFFNKDSVPSARSEIDNKNGYLVLGASLKRGDFVNVPEGAVKLLCQINFSAIKTGSSELSIIPTGSLDYPDDSFLWDTLMHNIVFTSESCSVSASAMPTPPVADFTFAPSNPKANQTVNFDASKSFDPDGEIISYTWDFGDTANETTTNVTATHKYILNGIYLVNLTVIDNDSNSSWAVKQIPVGGIPVANFTYDPLEPNPYTIITFNASMSYDPDGTIVSYYWDFGDGANETATEANMTHFYERRGVFWVNLTVFDDLGLYKSFRRELFVGKRPVVYFDYSPRDPPPAVNETITFDASYSRAGEVGDFIAFYIWDFGDGLYGEIEIVDASDPDIAEPWIAHHAYLGQGGTFPVNLTVVDNHGLYSSYIENVNVTKIIVPRPGTSDTMYIAAAVSVVVIIIAAFILNKRRKPELARKERYRVI